VDGKQLVRVTQIDPDVSVLSLKPLACRAAMKRFDSPATSLADTRVGLPAANAPAASRPRPARRGRSTSANDWNITTAAANGLLKVRHGVIQEVGIPTSG
jgi:hypothetical protein